MRKQMSLEELQRQDHDTLVSIVVKLDDLKVDVKEMKDGVNQKIADHEIRIKKIEDLALATDAPNSYKQMLKIMQDVRDMRLYVGVAGAIGAVFMFVITQLPNWIRLIWK